jgi:hypothetical protein
VLVAIFLDVAVGICVFVAAGEFSVQVAVGVASNAGGLVEVAVGRGLEVAVDRGLSVAVDSAVASLVAVPVGGINSKLVGVGVGVPVEIATISGIPPVSGGLLIPSKSRIMSRPIAGTEGRISSTL